MLGNILKSASGIAILVALLSAIDFGRQDINKFKQSLTEILKDPGKSEQRLQDIIKDTTQEFRQQVYQPEPKKNQQIVRVQKQKQEQEKAREQEKTLYSGGDWDPDKFFIEDRK